MSGCCGGSEKKPKAQAQTVGTGEGKINNSQSLLDKIKAAFVGK